MLHEQSFGFGNLKVLNILLFLFSLVLKSGNALLLLFDPLIEMTQLVLLLLEDEGGTVSLSSSNLLLQLDILLDCRTVNLPVLAILAELVELAKLVQLAELGRHHCHWLLLPRAMAGLVLVSPLGV